MFSTSKVKKNQKFEKIRRSLKAQPNILYKIIGTPNLPIRMNIPKKIYLVPQKCKRAKNSYRSYSTEFAGSTQNLKKIVGTSN
jgi:hypothetical protein